MYMLELMWVKKWKETQTVFRLFLKAQCCIDLEACASRRVGISLCNGYDSEKNNER